LVFDKPINYVFRSAGPIESCQIANQLIRSPFHTYKVWCETSEYGFYGINQPKSYPLPLGERIQIKHKNNLRSNPHRTALMLFESVDTSLIPFRQKVVEI
jgi:hypothetical protein